MYDDKPLNKELTLMDVAYIYAWRRVNQKCFYFYYLIQNELVIFLI
jgi:hypothetical protein